MVAVGGRGGFGHVGGGCRGRGQGGSLGVQGGCLAGGIGSVHGCAQGLCPWP